MEVKTCDNELSFTGLPELRSFRMEADVDKMAIYQVLSSSIWQIKNICSYLRKFSFNAYSNQVKKVWKGDDDARVVPDCRKITTPRSKINGAIVRYFFCLLSVRPLPTPKESVAERRNVYYRRRNISVLQIPVIYSQDGGCYLVSLSAI
jgi:hypothetical protein